MLAATIFTLTGVFVPIAFWSTRYFTTLPNVGRVKSSVDDLNGTGYCKHESSLCATICWGSASVPGFVRWTARFIILFLVSVRCLSSPPQIKLVSVCTSKHFDCYCFVCSNTAKPPTIRTLTRTHEKKTLVCVCVCFLSLPLWQTALFPVYLYPGAFMLSCFAVLFIFLSFTTINQSKSIVHSTINLT